MVTRLTAPELLRKEAQFLLDIADMMQKYDYRFGQAAFHCAEREGHTIESGSELDPFYHDDRVDGLIREMRNQWR
jgi:hypothetical protein